MQHRWAEQCPANAFAGSSKCSRIRGTYGLRHCRQFIGDREVIALKVLLTPTIDAWLGVIQRHCLGQHRGTCSAQKAVSIISQCEDTNWVDLQFLSKEQLEALIPN